MSARASLRIGGPIPRSSPTTGTTTRRPPKCAAWGASSRRFSRSARGSRGSCRSARRRSAGRAARRPWRGGAARATSARRSAWARGAAGRRSRKCQRRWAWAVSSSKKGAGARRAIAPASPRPRYPRWWLEVEPLEALLEAPGVRPLGARERLEPLGDLFEALFARGLGEARVHLRVLVGLAGDRRLEVQL